MIDHSYAQAQANTESIGTSSSQRTSDIIDINHVIIHLLHIQRIDIAKQEIDFIQTTQ